MSNKFDTDKYESGYIPEYLKRVREPRRLLEIGVKNGGSLLLWCDLWPSLELVVGIDLLLPAITLPSKALVFQADQGDRDALDVIAKQTGPFDVIVDDASHFGDLSWNTFQALWPHVRPGGLYVVEDWATGYRGSWPDGEAYQSGPPPGHCAGMVGFVKRLVDEIDYGGVERLEVISSLAFVYKGA